jgi:hypothetical protein
MGQWWDLHVIASRVGSLFVFSSVFSHLVSASLGRKSHASSTPPSRSATDHSHPSPTSQPGAGLPLDPLPDSILRHCMQEDAYEQPLTAFLCESDDLETHWISSTHPEFDVNADYVRNYLEHIPVQSLDKLNAANALVCDAVCYGRG